MRLVFYDPPKIIIHGCARFYHRHCIRFPKHHIIFIMTEEEEAEQDRILSERLKRLVAAKQAALCQKEEAAKAAAAVNGNSSSQARYLQNPPEAYATRQLKPTGFADAIKQGADVPSSSPTKQQDNGVPYKSVRLKAVVDSPQVTSTKTVEHGIDGDDDKTGELYKSVHLKKTVATNGNDHASFAEPALPHVALHKAETNNQRTATHKFELPAEFAVAKQNLKHRVQRPTPKATTVAPTPTTASPAAASGQSASPPLAATASMIRPTTTTTTTPKTKWWSRSQASNHGIPRRQSPASSPRNLQPGSKAYYQEIKRRRGLPTTTKTTSGALTKTSRRVSYFRTIMLMVLAVLFILVATPVLLVVIARMDAQHVPDAFLPVQGHIQTAVQHACQKLDEINRQPPDFWLPNKIKNLPKWVPGAQALVEHVRQMAACRPSQILPEQAVDRDSDDTTNGNVKEGSLDDDATGAVDNTTTNGNHMDAEPKEAEDEVAENDKPQEKPLENSSSSRDEPRRKGPGWLRKLKSMLRRKQSLVEVPAEEL